MSVYEAAVQLLNISALTKRELLDVELPVWSTYPLNREGACCQPEKGDADRWLFLAFHWMEHVVSIVDTRAAHRLVDEFYAPDVYGAWNPDARLAELKGMDYRSEYLRSDEWSVTRDEALARAGYRCSTCDADGPLDVHHRTYARLGQEDPGDVIALCRSCHTAIHGYGGKAG